MFTSFTGQTYSTFRESRKQQGRRDRMPEENQSGENNPPTTIAISLERPQKPTNTRGQGWGWVGGGYGSFCLNFYYSPLCKTSLQTQTRPLCTSTIRPAFLVTTPPSIQVLHSSKRSPPPETLRTVRSSTWGFRCCTVLAAGGSLGQDWAAPPRIQVQPPSHREQSWPRGPPKAQEGCFL
uniref:Uncharacterized protein n=1 Tax=Sphaerodactylus townsendi TaxID=933632 RepID=A0ACB8EAX2_9SAUR